MSLRQSPTRTAALVAANRSNARKSTGPKTDRGKGFSQLNSLQQGRDARMFRSNLVRARRRPQLDDWLYAAIPDALGASNPRQRQKRSKADKKVDVRDFRVPARPFGRKPESALESMDL